MIAEIVTFPLPPGRSRADVLEDYSRSIPKWRTTGDLIRKYYLIDEQAGTGGGIYIWANAEAAAREHGDAWRARIIELFGAEPVVTYFDASLVIDNLAGSVTRAG